MKLISPRMLPAFVAVCTLCLSLGLARAQEIKPVAVVSVASIDKILGDAEFLATLGGAGDQGRMLRFLAAGFLGGIDQSKPLGAYVELQGLDAKVTGFLPVTDLATLLTNLKNQGRPVKDVGGGVQQIGDGDQTAFLKEQGGWAFVAQKAEHLARLPADPSKLLGGLDKQYDLALRGNVQYVSKEAKQTAISLIQSQAEAQLRDNIGGAGDREAAEKLTRGSVKSIVSLIEETDQITVGWGVDRTAKTTFIDFSMTAVDGTPTAKRMAMAGNAKSNFAGFLMPEAALNFNFTEKLLKEDIDQYAGLLKPLRAQALKEIDNDSDIGDAKTRADAKEVLGNLIDVLQATLESGKLDAGASVFLEPKMLSLAAGLYVADGAKLEQSLKKGAAIAAKTEPDFPKVNFDAEKHKGISFHTFSIPVPGGEEDARQLLGDSLEVVLGTGPSAFYVAFGKNSAGTLKKVIDKSAADADKVVPPMQLNVSLAPIARTAAAMKNNPPAEAIAAALDKVPGKDHVRLNSKPIPRGVVTRLELEEGVIQVIGQAAKLFGGGGRPPF